MRRGESSGFTLIELMIVIAIIAVIAAVSVPNLLAAKLNANESSAIATLRNLVSAQAQVSVSGKIDVDKDGKGEYGTFLEMCGAVGVRRGAVAGTPVGGDFSVKGEVIAPPILSASFSQVGAAGFSTKSGYAFVVCLPDTATPAGFVYETGPAASVGLAGGTGTVGVDMAETSWCAYAQPMQIGGTGSRRFFASHRGDIMQSGNEVAKGQGNLTPIQGNAAFLGGGITSAVAVGVSGQDGDTWKVAN